MKRLVVFVVLWLLSVGLFAYPGVASILHNRALANTGESWVKENSNPDLLKYDESIEYNKNITAYPIVDPWISELRQSSPKYDEYMTLLNDGSGQMGVIEIPKLGQKLPIYHDEVGALDKGVQHLYGTSLPIGGSSTMSVLTGHTGLPNLTVFDNIPKLVPGDSIVVYAGGHKTVYKMTSHKVVLPDAIDAVEVEEGKDRLVLITCTPYGVNSHRYILIADRVPDEEVTEKDVEVVKTVASFGFMDLPMAMRIMLCVSGFIFILGLYWFIRDLRSLLAAKKRKKQKEEEEKALAAKKEEEHLSSLERPGDWSL